MAHEEGVCLPRKQLAAKLSNTKQHSLCQLKLAELGGDLGTVAIGGHLQSILHGSDVCGESG